MHIKYLPRIVVLYAIVGGPLVFVAFHFRMHPALLNPAVAATLPGGIAIG